MVEVFRARALEMAVEMQSETSNAAAFRPPFPLLQPERNVLNLLRNRTRRFFVPRAREKPPCENEPTCFSPYSN